MADIFYVYPKWKKISFTTIAMEHIKQLQGKLKIQEINEEALDNLQWLQPRDILLHPVLYVTIGDRANLFEGRQQRLRKMLKVKRHIGGFETADSNRISKVAVNALDNMNLLFLPSKFAIDAFKNSGVSCPLVHLPHGVNDIMTSQDRKITDEGILKIKRLKEKHSATLVLYFLLHSDYRKGADLVYEAMSFLQQRNPNLFLVLKRGQGSGPLFGKLKTLKLIEIPTWISDSTLKQLYDVCDILIVPSRGGGFELNALEGIARGLPTLVPNAGCFLDYSDYAIPLPITGHPKIFPDNPIHEGLGWETNSDQLAYHIESVASDLPSWKEKMEQGMEYVKQNYSWQRIGDDLYRSLVKYGFGG